MLRLRVWRLSKGLTQVNAARKLGMNHLTFGYLESGRLRPTEKDLERLRSHFGSQTTSLFEEIFVDGALK